MGKYQIIGFCQIYNELRKGNLHRFLTYFQPLVDAIVAYDDGSTDGSYETLLQYTPHVIRGGPNEFQNEISHKQLLLNKALQLNPDFLLWLDADEVLTANAAERLQSLCEQCIVNQIDGLAFHELNLWRSKSWRRLDSLYNDGWFVRLWRVTPEIAYSDLKSGLHQPPYPTTLKTLENTPDIQVIHYGFSSPKHLAYKYLIYQSHGQSGYALLDRLIDESQLVVEKVPAQLFPEGLYIDDEQPYPLPFEQALAYVEQYREEVFQP
jgi:glycosyltransferase involved in cell wall biosynthesis